MQSPFGVAHRGGSLENLENSPSAFRHALELGFKVIETDVQATADGELVVIHDADTKRVSPTVVTINDVTWRELSTLKLANGELLWRLQDLVLATAPDVRLNIDPKSDEAVNPLIEYLKGHPEVSRRICIGSFSARRLKRIRKALPELATSLGAAEMAWLVLAFVSGQSPVSVKAKLASSVVAIQIPAKAYGFDFTKPRFIEFIHQLGLDIHVWTIDSEPEMQRLYARGVDAVMTDRPSILKSVLQGRGHWKGD